MPVLLFLQARPMRTAMVELPLHRLLQLPTLASRNLCFEAMLPTFGARAVFHSPDLRQLQLLRLPQHPLLLHQRPPPATEGTVRSQLLPHLPLHLFKSRLPSWRKIRYCFCHLDFYRYWEWSIGVEQVLSRSAYLTNDFYFISLSPLTYRTNGGHALRWSRSWCSSASSCSSSATEAGNSKGSTACCRTSSSTRSPCC